MAFIRSEDGTWLNLNMYSRIGVRKISRDVSITKCEVYAAHGGYSHRIKLTESYEEAQKWLDEIMSK